MFEQVQVKKYLKAVSKEELEELLMELAIEDNEAITKIADVSAAVVEGWKDIEGEC